LVEVPDLQLGRLKYLPAALKDSAIELNIPQIPDKKIRLKWEKIILEAAQEANIELPNLQTLQGMITHNSTLIESKGSKTSSRKSDDPQ